MNTQTNAGTQGNDDGGNWFSNSVTIKLIIVVILTMLLLIPSEMIKSIIAERESLSEMTRNEVSAAWAEQQWINGPILTIPLIYEIIHDNNVTYNTEYWHILPEQLSVNGTLEPQTLRRGIYEVAVYHSDVDIRGAFKIDEQVERKDLYKIGYDQAFLTLGISDLRGIKENIVLKWGEHDISVRPGSKIPHVIASGITIDLPDVSSLKDSSHAFDVSLNLQGSRNISFVPIGSTTEVSLRSSWTSPGFNGAFLPDNREITEEGFTASWKVLQLNRNFPQSWTGANTSYNLAQSAFGVNLIVPLDDYQKSMRSVKYAIMTIALTFLIFFLVEILGKRRIHPFQYALVGLALCLFYILLISISEQSNFNLAYIISFLGIVIMVSLYSLKIFHSSRLTLLLVVSLTGIYGFMYVTLQLTDYALLMGSVGLAVILALTMYFTRNIDWYRLRITTSEVDKVKAL